MISGFIWAFCLQMHTHMHVHLHLHQHTTHYTLATFPLLLFYTGSSFGPMHEARAGEELQDTTTESRTQTGGAGAGGS